jgi:3-oxoacyl-[acyl-carrier-protein] synthase-3
MGTIIESVAVTEPSIRHPRRNAIDLATRAAQQCLDATQTAPNDVDVLINTGIYRDKHLGEPALAALIQDDLGLNTELSTDEGRHGTFSFDVLNGVCGALTAFHLVDCLMRAGTIQCALIVAEDTRPERIGTFPFAPAGGAALLRWSDGRAGMLAHRMHTFPEDRDAFTSTVSWHPAEHHLPGRLAGHNTMTIERSDSFDEVAAATATRALGAFLSETGLTLDARDCLVVAGLEESDDLAALDGLESCRIVGVPAGLATVHSVGPLAALASAQDAGHLGAAENVVVLAVAAGITVGITHYRP